MIRVDVAIIGAGMAGASLAAEIGDRAKVLLIEAEAQPGYHATGRSAAFWTETYGGPAVQPLTSASGPWLADHGMLRPRGALHLAGAGGMAALDRIAADFAGSGVRLDRLAQVDLLGLLPGLRDGWAAGLLEPTTCDIDVAALHAHYLAAARRAGVALLCDAGVTALARGGDGWRIETHAGPVHAAVVVNAAGAWATPVAVLAGAAPIAITPYRRTIVQLAVDPPVPVDLPLVLDAGGRFYFKPEAGGRLWLSPHDETLAIAGDVAPEELDVALAIDRLERVMDWRVIAKERAWAGLRSFSPDRAPVYGFDDRAPGFFWFAGQGGFGIQTAPAAAMLGAALFLGAPPPEVVAGIDAGRYAPGRFG
ncbi:NAD(P)/FAD-dependent oxidoreductase [Sphingomonas solaris]|uniref:FAD-binding oxidoreductase n=1 Tax=Alterirhizorhabdus solaris TaxID=2529389 RepID=A0A558QYY9_9SPHN|nr:FAD-dependent oxidoreductase [Sphingomonas solaris]TVV72366.1 FAD-binding oxidoreductase [Sphingomonas solaris]